MQSTNSSFQDQTMTCKDCGREFIWTAGEQEFYKQKGFENPPFRCTECRSKRKADRMSNRKMTKITCGKCGQEDEVPFVPRKGTAVLCRNCFAENKQQK